MLFRSGNIEMGASIFSVRQGRIRGQRSVVSDLNHGVDESDSMKWLLTEIYGDLLQDIPSTIYVNVVPSTLDSLIGWLQEIRGSKVEIKVPKRGDKSDLLEIVRINAVEAVSRHQVERSSDLSKRAIALNELQQALSIPNPVLRIECFDISHIQGSHAVGSMVVFEDGAARKAEYRRFAIRGRGDSDVD